MVLQLDRRAPLIAAIDRLIEVNSALRKRRRLASLERGLERAMRKAFRQEGLEFLKRLALLKSSFPPEVREVAEHVDWSVVFDEAALATLKAFSEPLDEFTAKALESGMIAAVADLSVETSFTLEHPAAVDYLKTRGGERITQITDTTRDGVRRILTQAADEGWSYDRTAEAIHKRYKHMSVERGRNIAVFELGDAYEHGNMLVGKSLQDAGLEMQKKWSTVGDSSVRPAHQANQAQEWIPLDDAFANDGDRPPSDPKCRCTLLMRRKPDDE